LFYFSSCSFSGESEHEEDENAGKDSNDDADPDYDNKAGDEGEVDTSRTADINIEGYDEGGDEDEEEDHLDSDDDIYEGSECQDYDSDDDDDFNDEEGAKLTRRRKAYLKRNATRRAQGISKRRKLVSYHSTLCLTSNNVTLTLSRQRRMSFANVILITANVPLVP
jgi:hypothetical protein